MFPAIPSGTSHDSVIATWRKLAVAPKDTAENYAVKREFRHKAHAELMDLPLHTRLKTVGDLIELAHRGELSPQGTYDGVTYAEHARKNQFPKGAGAPIRMLAGYLDDAGSPKKNLLTQHLRSDLQATAKAIQIRKPWVGHVEPSPIDNIPYLKNNPTIGRLPEAALSGKAKDIAFVGDGLTANLIGYLLNKVSRKYRFDFHEIREAAGGRMHTHTTPGGARLMGGSMRYPLSGRELIFLAKELGMLSRTELAVHFPHMGGKDDCAIMYKGKKSLWLAGKDEPEDPYLKSVYHKFRVFEDKLRKPLDDARAAHDKEAVASAWGAIREKYGPITVKQMLSEECAFDHEDIEAFESIGLSTGALQSYLEHDVSALEFIREFSADYDRAHIIFPDGPREMVDRLGSSVSPRSDGTAGSLNDLSNRYVNHQVTRVLREKDKAVLEYRMSNDPESDKVFAKKYDAVVMTATAKATARIDTTGVFTAEERKALENADFMHSNKLMVDLGPKAFWRTNDGRMQEGMYPVMVSDQEAMRGTYFVDGLKGHVQGYLNYFWGKTPLEKSEYLNQNLKAMAQASPEMSALVHAHLEHAPASSVVVKAWDDEGGAFRELSAKNIHVADVLPTLYGADKYRDNKPVVVSVNADHLMGGYATTAIPASLETAIGLLEHDDGMTTKHSIASSQTGQIQALLA